MGHCRLEKMMRRCRQFRWITFSSVCWVTSSPILRHRESSWCELSEGSAARSGIQTDGAQIGSRAIQVFVYEYKRNLLLRLFLKRHQSKAMGNPMARQKPQSNKLLDWCERCENTFSSVPNHGVHC